MSQYQIRANAAGFERIEYQHNGDWSGPAFVRYMVAPDAPPFSLSRGGADPIRTVLPGEAIELRLPGPVLKAIMWESTLEERQAEAIEELGAHVETLANQLDELKMRIELLEGARGADLLGRQEPAERLAKIDERLDLHNQAGGAYLTAIHQLERRVEELEKFQTGEEDARFTAAAERTT